MARSKSSNSRRQTLDIVLTSLGVIATVALLVIGGLAWWAYSFTTSTVQTELSAQKIYFPTLGSPELASPQIGPYLDQYAGQQLVNGTEAMTYADHFIAVHLSEVAGGQTYAQVSSQAQVSPSNTQLQQEKQTLFQGETLRGLLLNAYAFWTVGSIAQIVALVCFAAGIVMALLSLLGYWHLSRV